MVKNDFKYIIIPALRVICRNRETRKIFDIFSLVLTNGQKVAIIKPEDNTDNTDLRGRSDPMQTRFT